MSTLPLSSRLAALALAAAATGVQAAELGDATVRSYLGQPLSADIELTDLTAQDLADLQARLARPDVFAGANVTMSPALAGANVSVVRRDGRRVLHIATSAPVQGEVLHLYFDLVSAGREKVRGVTLWLTPDPNPPARVAAAPAPVVATALPGKDATKSERELLASVERAFAAREPKKPAKPVLTAETLRKEAQKYASTADDFRRGAPKTVAEPKPEPKVAAHEPEERETKKKPAGRLQLASHAELAEAARATKASVEGAAKPAPVPAPAPKAPEADPAMLKKLAELESKLKSLQKMVDERPAPVPVAAPKPAEPAVPPPQQPVKQLLKPQVAEAPVPVTPQSPPAKPITPAPQLASADEEGERVTASAQATSAAAMATVDEPKKEAEPPKEAKAPEPPPEKKEMKISRPKILTFLFAGSIVLLLVFGVIVHFIRKAKNKRSPIVRQTWARDEDDASRREPTVQSEAPPAA